jgi:2-polyprenyl-3-methyl-5-hydroxy-6-metoxy-1,4-benzoquinol methylase
MLSIPHEGTDLIASRPAPEFDHAQRSSQGEILDGGIDAAELKLVLRDLARFNGAMLGHWPVVAWLRRATRHLPRDQPLILVDVGCGYGDLLRAIHRWSRKRGLVIKLIGLDLSRETIDVARAATDAADQIEYQVADIFAYRAAEPVDFVVSSLLTHHLSDAMIVSFLRWMEATARKGWLIYDLQRHVMPYVFIGLMGKLTSLHPIVIYDGQISVARSLTRAEWRQCIAAAGLVDHAVDLHWFLYRFVIGRLR